MPMQKNNSNTGNRNDDENVYNGRGRNPYIRTCKDGRVAAEKPVYAEAEREGNGALQRFAEKIFSCAQPRSLGKQQGLAVYGKPAESGDCAGHGKRERAPARQRADAHGNLEHAEQQSFKRAQPRAEPAEAQNDRGAGHEHDKCADVQDGDGAVLHSGDERGRKASPQARRVALRAGRCVIRLSPSAKEQSDDQGCGELDAPKSDAESGVAPRSPRRLRR